jgi:glycosyltransferase involved in cell wall biosynthesis
MRVLFIGRYDIATHNIRPEAEMIIGLRKKGVEVGVMTKADCYYARRMAEAGIQIYDYVPRKKFSIRAIRIIRQALVAGQYDVMHLFNNRAIVNGIFASLGLPVKVVTYRGQTGNISRYDPSCYLTHLNPRVDKIVCVADAVRLSLEDQVSDPRKLITIYKGHDITWYQDIDPVSRATLGVPEDAFVVGCVANNRPRKGVPVLIEAANFLDRDANVHFLLVGSGMDTPTLARMISDSSHADRFHVLGQREHVLPIVLACDITVLPSTKREGLPKTVIESMALGIPPIATATGGSPELVDKNSGRIVPPGDAQALAQAIDELRADRERLRQMGESARRRIASDFRLEDSINAHYALYAKLLDAQ